jgi:hypothetical protein
MDESQVLEPKVGIDRTSTETNSPNSKPKEGDRILKTSIGIPTLIAQLS